MTGPTKNESSVDIAQQLAAAVHPVFAVEAIITEPGGRTISLKGQLLTDSESAYSYIEARFNVYGYTPLLRKQKDHILVSAVPIVFMPKSSNDYGAILLFGVTVLSVLYAGALMQAPDFTWPLRHPLAGLPFAFGLLTILVAHELGHYLTARRMGVATSLPYFIPMPLNFFGTMGAIIRTRAPMRNRRQVLAIGAAGPLAGLIVAIPVLVFGLLRSQVLPIPRRPGIIMEGNFLLYALLKFLVFRRFLPSHGYDVFLHPTAFGAWAALLVTGLNLTPAGQLDGGHVAYALLGKHARWLSRLAVIVALALGMVWSGWFLFSLLLLAFGQRHADPLDDVTSLTTKEKLFAIFMLLVFVLLFTPVPLTVQ
ncbi:MAG: site-2 protease family protein [Anaerolineae bacterium]